MAKVDDDFADFFGDDDDAPVVDTRAEGRLLRVPLSRMSPNLVNPRADFGTDDQLIDFGKSLARRQNQAVPVVSKKAYLDLWPDHAKQVGNVDFVIVSGERRYRAGSKVGLAALDCIINDAFAASRKVFMEAVVSENVDRQNFDVIEEAYAVEALVREFGSNRAVAQHFERADGWVTQRILLTHLAPPIQDLVRTKALPLEPARTLGKLARDKEWTAGDQLAWWEDQQGVRKAAAQERKQVKRAASTRKALPPPPPAPEETSPSEETKPTETAARSFTAVKPKPVESVRTEVPEPRAETTERPHTPTDKVDDVPWDDPEAFFKLASDRMTRENIARLTSLFLRFTAPSEQAPAES